MKSYVIKIMDNEKSVKAAELCISTAKRNAGIDVKIFKAITPKNNPQKRFRDLGLTAKNFDEKYSKSQNAMAAFLSHYTLWTMAVKDSEDYIIFEHDAVIDTNIPTIGYSGAITFSQPSYGKYNTPMFIGVGPLTQKNYFGGAHGYIVTPSGAEKIIEAAKKYAAPTDVYLNMNLFPWLQESYPWSCRADDNFSTIQRENGCIAKHNYKDGYEYLK